ncbi:hypothetical protein LZ32DRAFT_630696 [Colletotrichum eremochloae]|nr:hypothetical protein LZ32DRAFT_630696 [Colletotrichum eremochloae]
MGFNCEGVDTPGTLDEAGFCYVTDSTKLLPSDFEDRESIEKGYLPECEELLRQVMDRVDEVAIYDWRVRHTDLPTRQGSVVDLNNPMSPIGAATHVHVDQSPSSVVERIKRMFPDRQHVLLQSRVRLINLWRPINGPIQNWPLAVCDGRTLSESNLVETERIRRTFTGNTMFLMQGTGVKWFYMSEQNDDEVLIFKSFDSREDVTRYAAHGSFKLPDSSEGLPPRQSIEVRALVFSYPATE